jgi:hypothetical protein
MNNKHLLIEIFELLLDGDNNDRRHAAFLARRLDCDTLVKLRAAAAEIALTAEDAYIELRRKQRAERARLEEEHENRD